MGFYSISCHGSSIGTNNITKTSLWFPSLFANSNASNTLSLYYGELGTQRSTNECCKMVINAKNFIFFSNEDKCFSENLLDRTSGALQCRKLRVRRKKVAAPQDLTRSCQNISIWENIQENRKFYSAVPTYWFEGWFMGTIPVDQCKPYNFAAKIWAFENMLWYMCNKWLQLP